MDDLADAVPSLQYLVARPGTFTTFFPETTEDHLVSVLIDATAECHLEGLLLDIEADDDGLLTPAASSGQAALITLFAGIRFLRAELINRNTSETYKAGTASYEFVQATNILRDILKGLIAQKERAIDAGSTGAVAAAAAFFMGDQYLARVYYDDYATSTALIGW